MLQAPEAVEHHRQQNEVRLTEIEHVEHEGHGGKRRQRFKPRAGLAVALAEAALWSGIGAELDLPEDEVALFGEGGGQAVVACAPEDVARLGSRGLTRLGIVGGDTICGVPVAELRRVRQGDR